MSEKDPAPTPEGAAVEGVGTSTTEGEPNTDLDNSGSDEPQHSQSTQNEGVTSVNSRNDKPLKKPLKLGTVPNLLAIGGVVFLVVVGIGLAVVVLQNREQQSLHEQVTGLTQQVERQKNDLDLLLSKVNEQNQSVDKLLEANQQTLNSSLQAAQQQLQQQVQQLAEKQYYQVDQLQQRVDAQQQRLMNLSTTSREDWLLAEAEYLLKLANQRVLLERTPENAIALLQAADNIVQQVSAGLGDAELFAVRQALARELAALKLVVPVDKDGVYLQLQALIEQVESLPRVPPTKLGVERKPEAEATAEQSRGWWQRALSEVADMAGFLDNYIRFDNAETPENPLIASHVAQLAALNIRIALEQAQVALLKEEPSIYQQAVQKADTMIGQYYYASDAAQQFHSALKDLLQVQVAAPLPDVSGSLQLLHSYTARLHRVQPKTEGQL